jgi:hypothetical protein
MTVPDRTTAISAAAIVALAISLPRFRRPISTSSVPNSDFRGGVPGSREWHGAGASRPRIGFAHAKMNSTWLTSDSAKLARGNVNTAVRRGNPYRSGRHGPRRLQTEAMMTKSDRRTGFSTAFFAFATSFLLALAAAPAPAVAATGAPPFCVLRGGSQGGGTAPQVCAYFDYQVCLQAAADLHGNCVQNIDYHGEVSTAPARVRTRHRP